MSSPFLLEPPDYGEMAQDLVESYQSFEAQPLSESDILPPKDPVDPVADVANLLFGDEMAAVGASYDKKGLKFELETFTDAWTEHPLISAVATATSLIPVLGAAKKLRRAKGLSNINDDLIKQAGWVDEGVDLAQMSDYDKDIARINIHHLAEYKDTSARRAILQDPELRTNASPKEQAKYWIDKAFTNTYLEHVDPINSYNIRAEWAKGTSAILAENGHLTRHLKNLPPDDPILGSQIVRMLQDPNAINDIPEKYREAALLFAEDKRNLDLITRAEGFISKEEAEHIGDVWVSTTREGTQTDLGKFTTILDRTSSGETRVLKVPKTTSPNLLQRKATKEEVKLLVDKQYAAELLSAGEKDKALSILEGSDFKDAKKLINEGDFGNAINLLTTEGKIDFTPKSLTYNTLFQQKLLFENFRMIRDIALNPSLTKPGLEIAKLSARDKKNWMKLDALPGSDRLRRMVAVSKQIDPSEVKELGWIPKSTFKELKEITGGEATEAVGGWMSFLSAIHKTSKTAWNIPTQFANAIGNWALLTNAGVNPFSKDFIDLQIKSASGVWQLQSAVRKGEDITKIKDLGKLDSLAVKGKKIDIAEELNSKELQDLIEKESMVSSEGLGVLKRIAESSNDEFLKIVAKKINTGITKTKTYIPSDVYQTSDAMTKMAYYLQLRQKGFSRQLASMEVARRLPMYASVGGIPKTARGWLQPWVTFPAEMARIIKNNAVDHPLKTAMMLQVPEIAQIGMYGTGIATGQTLSSEGIAARKQQLPIWAQKPSTVLTPFLDRNKDFRAMTMDWLPYTALMPPSIAQDAPFMKKLPFGADEPMPILNGLYMAMTGKDSWGRDIPTDPNNPSQKVRIMTTSLMGFLAPPFMEKYLFNVTEPDFGYRFFQDMGKNVNPYTEKPGDAVLDLFLNNLTPIKNYAASPEQQIANEGFWKQQVTNYRSKLSKEWEAMLKSGDTEAAAGRMAKIHETFVTEWRGDPAMAQRKMNEWLKNHVRTLRQHPQLRDFSKEEILWKIQNDTESVANSRSMAYDQVINSLRRELAGRGRNSQGGRKNPFLPDNF